MSKKAIRLGEYLEKEATLAENMADACNALEETVSFFYQQGAHSAAGAIIPYIRFCKAGKSPLANCIKHFCFLRHPSIAGLNCTKRNSLRILF